MKLSVGNDTQSWFLIEVLEEFLSFCLNPWKAFDFFPILRGCGGVADTNSRTFCIQFIPTLGVFDGNENTWTKWAKSCRTSKSVS